MSQTILPIGPQTVPIRSAVCAECGSSYEPYSRREGAQRFCSPECRTRHWKVEHGQAKPVQKSDADTHAARVYERLEQGRATRLELTQAGGGLHPGARIRELRAAGVRILGPRSWRRGDGTLETETVPRTAGGHQAYELRG